jgi:hypothetical protein
VGGKLLWFALGVGAYYVWEHYMPSPKMNAGKYKSG